MAQAPPPEKNDKGAGSAKPPIASPMDKFRSLAGRLLNVSRDELRTERERLDREQERSPEGERSS
jgi:hypothetical protein